jgi:hypothetical protein
LRRGAPALKIVAMTTNRRLTLHLEPAGDGKPIAGWLCDERGDERYFAGWLGLLTLLERARIATCEPKHGASQAEGDLVKCAPSKEAPNALHQEHE